MPVTVTALRKLSVLFDEVSRGERERLVRKWLTASLPSGKKLLSLYDDLLFMMAHPASREELQICRKVLLRIEQELKKHKSIPVSLENSGLPFTPATGRFSFDFLYWALQQKDITVLADFSSVPDGNLGEIIRPLLPSPLRYEHGTEYTWDEWFEALQVRKKDRTQFLISLFAESQEDALMRDYLFERLNLYATLYPNSGSFSKMHNHLAIAEHFIHKEIQRKYDFNQILESPLPEPLHQTEKEKDRVIQILRYSLALLIRETDPCTFLDRNNLRLYHLERGISVAVYGMKPERQLPFETYAGFTLLKNGYPAAYGGAWIFGRRARFGINIFETFRGGESGIMFSQILRVYARAFEIDHFEIEAYQFGADNPDGISSGAYWFYYKHGFRSMDKSLRKLAEKETMRMKRNKEYRSGESTLIRFTGANMELTLAGLPRPDVTSWTALIRNYVATMVGRGKKNIEYDAFHELRLTWPTLRNHDSARNIPMEWALLVKAGKNKIPFHKVSIDKMLNSRFENMMIYQAFLRKLLGQ